MRRRVEQTHHDQLLTGKRRDGVTARERVERLGLGLGDALSHAPTRATAIVAARLATAANILGGQVVQIASTQNAAGNPVVVAIGTKLGTMGSTGRSTGPHLHYEIHFRGKSYDPIKFLRAGKHVH